MVALNVFPKYLASMDGGQRPPDTCRDHASHVGRILFEIEDPTKDVTKLRKDQNLSLLMNTFIQGNNLLSDDEKLQPGTLKSYLTSLKLFFRFFLSRRSELTVLLSLTDQDIAEIPQADLRVSNWLKSFYQEMAERRIQKQEQDELEILSDDEYYQLVLGEAASKYAERFANMTANDLQTGEFVRLRD